MLTRTRGIHGQFVIKMEVIMCGFLCARDGSRLEKRIKNQLKKMKARKPFNRPKWNHILLLV